MTFFLGDNSEAAQDLGASQANPGPDQTDASIFDVMGAAARSEAIETNWWRKTERTEEAIEAQMVERLAQEFGITVEPFGERTGRFTRMSYREKLLGEAARAAARDPDRWGSLPKTNEEIRAIANKQLLEEYDEAQTVLGAGGRGSGIAEFIARMGVAATDPTSIALAPLGGPIAGNAGRFILSEMALGGLGEAMVLPRMQEQADRLGLPDPNAMAQIGGGIMFGGAFGVGGVGWQRGAEYARSRRNNVEESRPDHVDPVEHASNLAATEKAMADGGPIPDTPDRLRAKGNGWLEDLGVIDQSDPNFHYGRSASSSAQQPRGLVIHHTSDKLTLEQAVDYGKRVDPGRGGAFGYHFYVGKDGRVILGAPLGMRTNHLKPPSAPQRRGLTDLSNRDTLSISLVGAEHGATPAQIAAAERLGRAVMGRYDIPPERVFGHGDLQTDRQHHEGVEVVQRLREGTGYTPSGPVPFERANAHALNNYTPTRTSRAFTGSDQITNGNGMTIDVEYEVVELEDLIAASGELQNRDRSRASSTEQISKMAAELDPELLLPSPLAQYGAPIVGPDNIVESGNGRVGALRRASVMHSDRFDAYRERIGAIAEVPDDMKYPVLVARRQTEMSDAERVQFTRGGNDSPIARMSATEQAATDAAGLKASVLELFNPAGGLATQENAGFVRAFLDSLPQAERNGLVAGDGSLNAEGLRRLRQALFARAFDDVELIAKFAEEDGGAAQALLNALAEVAPSWAGLRTDIEAGLIKPEMDITPQVQASIKMIARARADARREGISTRAAIEGAIAQSDMLTGDVDPVTQALVAISYRDGRARAVQDVTDVLRRYTVEARIHGNPDAGLFGDALSSGPAEILYALDGQKGIGIGGGRVGPGDQRIESGRDGPGPAQAGGRSDQPGDGRGDAGGAETQAGAEGRQLTDPADPAAPPAVPEPIEDPDIAALREEIDAMGDMEVEIEGAGGPVRASDMLRDLEDDGEFLEVLDVCAMKSGAA